MRRGSFVALLALATSAGCKRTQQQVSPVPSTTVAASATTKDDAEPAPSVMPRAKVLAIINPEGLPEYTGKTGTLEGHIYVEGDPAPDRKDVDYSACPAAKERTGKLFREQNVGGTRALLDAVIGVTGYRDAYIPSRKEAQVVEIKDCVFTRRTVVLTLGERLDILNRERPAKENFFAPDLAGNPTKVLRLATPGGDAVHLYPKQITRDRLVDKMNHKYMSADVFVGAQPLNAVSVEGGAYRIEGVPVGRMSVTACWTSCSPTARSKMKPRGIAVAYLGFALLACRDHFRHGLRSGELAEVKDPSIHIIVVEDERRLLVSNGARDGACLRLTLNVKVNGKDLAGLDYAGGRANGQEKHPIGAVNRTDYCESAMLRLPRSEFAGNALDTIEVRDGSLLLYAAFPNVLARSHWRSPLPAEVKAGSPLLAGIVPSLALGNDLANLAHFRIDNLSVPFSDQPEDTFMITIPAVASARTVELSVTSAQREIPALVCSATTCTAESSVVLSAKFRIAP
jgi:hypothetical protein